MLISHRTWWSTINNTHWKRDSVALTPLCRFLTENCPMETCLRPLPRLATVSLLHKHPGFFPDTFCLIGGNTTCSDHILSRLYLKDILSKAFVLTCFQDQHLWLLLWKKSSDKKEKGDFCSFFSWKAAYLPSTYNRHSLCCILSMLSQRIDRKNCFMKQFAQISNHNLNFFLQSDHFVLGKMRSYLSQCVKHCNL